MVQNKYLHSLVPEDILPTSLALLRRNLLTTQLLADFQPIVASISSYSLSDHLQIAKISQIYLIDLTSPIYGIHLCESNSR